MPSSAPDGSRAPGPLVWGALAIALACLAGAAWLAYGVWRPAPPRADFAALLPSPRPSPDPGDRPPPGSLAGPFLFYDDFEQAPARWRFEGGADGVGFGRLRYLGCSGVYTLHAGRRDHAPFRPTPLTATATLEAPIDLTEARRPLLRYDVRGSAEPPDALVIQPQVRRQGETAWHDVGEPARARYPLMMTRYALLTPFTGARITLRFRARLAPGAGETRGVYLDEIQVIESAP